MTLIQKYKDNPDIFKLICDHYADCECIDNIEGKVINGEWSGYCLTDLDCDAKYFVEEGVRGISRHWFVIENGIPRKIHRPVSEEQMEHIFNIMEMYLYKCGYTDKIENRYSIRRNFINTVMDNWTMDDTDINRTIRELKNPKYEPLHGPGFEFTMMSPEDFGKEVQKTLDGLNQPKQDSK